MKRIILLCSLIALALNTNAQNFTTGSWNKLVAKDTLWLSGRGIAEVVYILQSTAKNNELPTAKAVYDYVILNGRTPDSTWVKTSGSYLNKRITDDVYRTGKSGINTTSPTRNLDVTGSFRGTVQDRGGAVYNVAAYDILPNGMDVTANLRKLLDTMFVNGGGTLQFNEGVYRVTGTLTPKWSNQCIGKSVPLKVLGAGAFMQGQLGTGQAAGGTILRFVSTDSIMWSLRGVGLTEFSGLTFVDSAVGGAKMFIRTTLNTIHVHDCAFFGDKSAFSAEDRAIVCGSTLEGTGDGLCADGDTSMNSAFQGYGTVIRDNFFNSISYGVWLRQFANAVHVLNNTWWNNCGGDAAIQVGLPGETNAAVSNLISGNLIEMVSYRYGIRCQGAPKSIIVENQFYDHSDDSLRYDVYLDNASEYSYLELPYNYGTDTSKIFYDGSQTATVLITEQNYPSRFPQGLKVKKHFQYTDAGNNSGVWITSGGKKFYQTWASDGVSQYVENSPPTAVHLSSFRDAGSGSIIWRMPGTNQFLDADGSLRIRATGTDIYFQTNSNQNHLISNGTMYGGLTSTTTTFKMGQGDFLYWSDGASPTNGSSAGLTSSAATVLRTVNGSGTDAQHQALDFKATGTGANQLPVGTTAQEPSPSDGMIRYNTTLSRPRTVVSGAWANIVTTATLPDDSGIAANTIKTYYESRALPTAVNSIVFIGLVTPGSSGNGVTHARITVVADGSGVAVAKSYDVPLAFNASGGGWETLLPISNNGPYSSAHDFDLEIRSASDKDSLRIRRTLGTNAATARITLEFTSFDAGLSFSAISSTGTSAAAAGGTYRGHAIYQQRNKVGLNNIAPARTLHVTGEVRVTDLTTDSPTLIVGADGDGDFGAISVGSGLSLSGGTLTATGGATDHGALTGLGDDDHTQYLLLAGRSGGQIATGGTGSGDDLTLRSTSNSTKGDVLINDQGGNTILGGGELSNELRFMEPAGSGANYTGFKSGAMGADQMYTLPIDAPANGEVLKWNTGGGLSWETDVSGGTNYQTFRDDGSAMTQRAAANFVSTATVTATLTDDSGNGETEVAMVVPTDGITATQIAANAVGNSEMADNAINTDEIVDGGVGSADLNQMGASTSQVLTWNGSVWAAQYVDAEQTITDLSANANNWNPTNWATENTFTVGADNLWNITGFTALPGGTERTIINSSGNAIIVASGHPDSDVANRVQGPCDYVIGPYGGSIIIRYSNNYSKWYVTSCTYNPASPGVNGSMSHYYNASVGATTGADWGTIGFGISSGANSTTAPSTTVPAGWEIGTASSAAGIATLYLSKTVLNPTLYSSAYMVTSTVVYFPTLSDGTQTYTFQFGLVPSPSSTTLAVNNTVAIRYSNGINSGKFQGYSRNNAGSESNVDLGITVAANTKYILTVVVDKAKTEGRFFINGTYAGRVTANLPNNVAVGTRAGIFKSAGTTSRTAIIPTYTFYTVYP